MTVRFVERLTVDFFHVIIKRYHVYKVMLPLKEV